MLNKKADSAINNLALSIPNIELLLSKVKTKQSLKEELDLLIAGI